MSRLAIAPIVEGHGDRESVRILLERIWIEVVGGDYIEVLRPIRIPKSKLVHDKKELSRAVELALLNLGVSGNSLDPAMVLVLIDADDKPACQLGPKLLKQAKQARSDADISCVVANVEYETWFVAAAESLSEFLHLAPENEIPAAPEESRSGKAWIERRWKGTQYSPTVDQPKLTRRMDLSRCRERSPSFDKLCRELERHLRSNP